ncbi:MULTISPECIES: hypothetical protein [unclassified Pseudomonas]|uniref:hypothetical protein n=1 Tax=unclassified Pseudomonas TaxID=196821 RepID=UPI000A1DF0F7|nr:MULTISPECIES: hypothetical protein [unclassified Pseudomonas]UDI95282.1 hypothetical protein I5961_12535 [Pseudomonas sp. IAC-BECa141]
MRTRGSVYWGWANPEIHFRNKDEILPDGKLVNVQVRTSKTGDVQLFLGVYGQAGTMLLEEGFDSRPGETMTGAMEWGFERAKEFIAMMSQTAPALGSESLPRRRSRQAI